MNYADEIAAAAILKAQRDPRNDREHLLQALDAHEARQADDLKRGIDRAVRMAQRVSDEPYFPACQSGPCEQGRKVCPCPESCRVPARVAGRNPLFWVLLAILLFWSAIGFGAYLIWRN